VVHAREATMVGALFSPSPGAGQTQEDEAVASRYRRAASIP
jgi:hypothetical protein